MDKLINGIKAKYDVPVIMFGVGASHLINEWNDLAIDVLIRLAYVYLISYKNGC